jgi:hypothetical protein
MLGGVWQCWWCQLLLLRARVRPLIEGAASLLALLLRRRQAGARRARLLLAAAEPGAAY